MTRPGMRWGIGVLVIVAMSVAAGSMSAEKRLAGAQRLVGTWRLQSRRDRTSEGAVQIEPSLGETPLGLLVYDANGNVAVQLMKRDRSADSAAAEPGANSGGTNSSAGIGWYDAYFGTYTVDVTAGTVTHHLEAALGPHDVGRSLTRHFELNGDELKLSFQTTVGSGTVVTREIVWKRVA